MSVNDPNELAHLFAERVSRADIGGLLELYEPEATLVAPDGEQATGEEAIRQLLENLIAAAPQITPLDARQTLRSDDIALLLTRWQMTLGGDGGPAMEGSSTEVARRQSDGSWRYVLDRPVIESIGPAAVSLGTQGVSAKEPPSFTQLRYAEDGPVARITLDRPDRRNALSMQLSDELIAAIGIVQRSQSVKVLVIEGADETFCAGDDINEMPVWGNADQVMRRARLYQGMANSLEELDKLTIAAVDGFAVGGGLEITMACDFVIATRRARWGMPEIDVGITPGWGGTTRMARLIGRRMTKEVNLLGALHPARRALSWASGTGWSRTTGSCRRSTRWSSCCSPRTSRPHVSSSSSSTAGSRPTSTRRKASRRSPPL